MRRLGNTKRLQTPYNNSRQLYKYVDTYTDSAFPRYLKNFMARCGCITAYDLPDKNLTTQNQHWNLSLVRRPAQEAES